MQLTYAQTVILACAASATLSSALPMSHSATGSNLGSQPRDIDELSARTVATAAGGTAVASSKALPATGSHVVASAPVTPATAPRDLAERTVASAGGVSNAYAILKPVSAAPAGTIGSTTAATAPRDLEERTVASAGGGTNAYAILKPVVGSATAATAPRDFEEESLLTREPRIRPRPVVRPARTGGNRGGRVGDALGGVTEGVLNSVPAITGGIFGAPPGQAPAGEAPIPRDLEEDSLLTREPRRGFRMGRTGGSRGGRVGDALGGVTEGVLSSVPALTSILGAPPGQAPAGVAPIPRDLEEDSLLTREPRRGFRMGRTGGSRGGRVGDALGGVTEGVLSSVPALTSILGAPPSQAPNPRDLEEDSLFVRVMSPSAGSRPLGIKNLRPGTPVRSEAFNAVSGGTIGGAGVLSGMGMQAQGPRNFEEDSLLTREPRTWVPNHPGHPGMSPPQARPEGMAAGARVRTPAGGVFNNFASPSPPAPRDFEEDSLWSREFDFEEQSILTRDLDFEYDSLFSRDLDFEEGSLSTRAPSRGRSGRNRNNRLSGDRPNSSSGRSGSAAALGEGLGAVGSTLATTALAPNAPVTAPADPAPVPRDFEEDSMWARDLDFEGDSLWTREAEFEDALWNREPEIEDTLWTREAEFEDSLWTREPKSTSRAVPRNFEEELYVREPSFHEDDNAMFARWELDELD